MELSLVLLSPEAAAGVMTPVADSPDKVLLVLIDSLQT
jgi:hypothetical protein